MAEIHRIEPNTAALFYSIDAEPKFAVTLCRDSTLFDAVRGTIFPVDGDLSQEQHDEITGHVRELRASGGVDFEDGWLALRVGMADVVAFLMEKVKDAR